MAVLQLSGHGISQVNKTASGEPESGKTVIKVTKKADNRLMFMPYLGIKSLPMIKLVMNCLVYWTRGKLKTQPTGE